MIRPRPLGLALRASQPSPASIRPDLRDTLTCGHTDTDTPTCSIHACVCIQTSLSCQSPPPSSFAPASASWNSGIANAQDARTYHFLRSAPGPYPWWPRSLWKTACASSLSQHCLSWHGDLEPPHWAEYGRSALPDTHIHTHVTLGQPLSLSGPQFRHL